MVLPLEEEDQAANRGILAITVATDGPPGSLRRETGAGYPEEIPLHNLELSTADFHPGV